MTIDEHEEESMTVGQLDSRNNKRQRRLRRRPRWLTAITATFSLLAIPLLFAVPNSKWGGIPMQSKEEEGERGSPNHYTKEKRVRNTLPKILMKKGIYNSSDFENSIHVTPPYWNFSHSNPKESNTWGPCFIPEHRIHWNDFHLDDDSYNNSTKQLLRVPLKYRLREKTRKDWEGQAGLCRPGFIILGAGKCGTSSLYHYLIGHPRVLPAAEKQIHYFKYYSQRPLGWYYSWFPTTETFLANGALMTGEASPGYLPYPGVVQKMAESQLESKLITLGRNPMDRIWSSYKYNYINPAIEDLRRGSKKGVPKGKDDDYYKKHHLFSLEELVRAELDQLYECFNNFGPNATRDLWYDQTWTRSEFDRRQKHGLPPLIDLDEVCYGKQISSKVVRKQWELLQTKNPEKYIQPKNAFLIQALIGRSIYVLPLEWWYIQFSSKQLLFVCTEELSNATALLNVARQLGLPDYDFENVIANGAYNVGGHRGYDKATPWQEIDSEANTTGREEEIPLSKDLSKELGDFLEPFNERLFALVGKRCDW